MTTKQYAIIAGICFVLSILFYALQHDWIIIRLPAFHKNTAAQALPCPAVKKKVQLMYWHNDTWHNETTELVLSTNKASALQYLLNTWLTLLDEEAVMEQKVSVQSVLLSSSEQDAYISFDRSPFSPESSTFDAWMFVEALLKTVRENDIKLQAVTFLVHHQPLEDDHLDFSSPWPSTGFLL